VGGKLEKALSCSCKGVPTLAERCEGEGSGDSRTQNYCSKAKSLSQEPALYVLKRRVAANDLQGTGSFARCA
jgi:hypothetical protein